MNSTDAMARPIRGASESPTLAHYLGFLAQSVGILAVLIAVGAYPTYRLGGAGALTAMWVGCAIGFMAALAGTVPVSLARGRPASETVPAVMGSIVLRLVAAVALGVAAAQVEALDVDPLLLWLVISHAGLMVADIRFTRRMLYPRSAPADRTRLNQSE